MNLFDPDPPDSSQPLDRPNWEERLVSDLKRVCPDWTGPQRRTVIRILKTWGQFLPISGKGRLDLGMPMVRLPRWLLTACPFWRGDQLRLLLKFFSGMSGCRDLNFTELCSALAALAQIEKEIFFDRREQPPPFGARLWVGAVA